MTQTEALKLALEAFKKIRNDRYSHWEVDKEIDAIKEALAQPEQEPVAWMTPDREGFRIRFSPPVNDVPLGWDALYITPPQRTWVGLTDEDVEMIVENRRAAHWEFVRQVEALIKEKNT